MQAVFIEPLSDIAVLGSPDGGEPELEVDYKAWLAFVTSVRPVVLSKDNSESPAIKFLSHEGHWVRATSPVCGRRIRFESELPIECGTSGGPIVLDDGDHLIGVCSNSGGCQLTEDGGGVLGSFVRLAEILPKLILEPDYDYFDDEGA